MHGSAGLPFPQGAAVQALQCQPIPGTHPHKQCFILNRVGRDGDAIQLVVADTHGFLFNFAVIAVLATRKLALGKGVERVHRR